METIKELFAIIEKETGNICLSRGGSSSKEKIMVYDNLKSAYKALNNHWTKQCINENDVIIKKIFNNL